jgi:hypothetical protein
LAEADSATASTDLHRRREPRGEATLAGYAAAEVDEVCFLLPTKPETDTLRDLDELADLARRFSR